MSTSSLSTLVDARAIVLLQDGRTRLWHETPPQAGRDDRFESMVEAQHAANFTLWHLEDDARLPQANDAAIAAVKRQIDRVNQERNDTTERIDACLLASLSAASPAQQGEQHSETPGMMIDRLSILSLKLFHTQQEIDRENAPAGHRERNATRLTTLQAQRDDLAACLDGLWAQICAGQRHFKQYRQLKMYNDPDLNPVVYRGKTHENKS